MVELTNHAHLHIPALVTVVVWLPELDFLLKILNSFNSIQQAFMVPVA